MAGGSGSCGADERGGCSQQAARRGEGTDLAPYAAEVPLVLGDLRATETMMRWARYQQLAPTTL